MLRPGMEEPGALPGRRGRLHLALPDSRQRSVARRRRKRIPLADLDARAEVALPATTALVAEEHELQRFLAARVRRLPFRYRAPLVLRDVVGLSSQEVADILELSLAAAKSRIHRARMQIRDDLAEWERG